MFDLLSMFKLSNANVNIVIAQFSFLVVVLAFKLFFECCNTSIAENSSTQHMQK